MNPIPYLRYNQAMQKRPSFRQWLLDYDNFTFWGRFWRNLLLSLAIVVPLFVLILLWLDAVSPYR